MAGEQTPEGNPFTPGFGSRMIEFADTGVMERAQAHHAELETRRRAEL